MKEITLYQPPTRPWQTPNMSPFCTKLECYLRMTEIPYMPAPMSRSQAPKGKIPYVDFGDGKMLGDSQLIIEVLEKQLGTRALDAGLSPRDAALGHVTRRTIEEGYYFIGLYNRWLTDEGFPAVRDEFKKFVPGFVLPLVRRDFKKKLHGQGTGRHSPDEVTAFGVADFAAVAELLGDRPFFFGEAPRVVDCVLYAFLEATLGFPVDSKLKAHIARHANLVAYRQRIRDRWWQDLGA